MAYNYLSIVNKVLTRVGEVVLTSSDFDSSVGFHAEVRNAVNNSIRDIYEYEDTEWPFLLDTTQTLTLTIGDQGPYTLASTLESIDWDSFIILPDTANDIYAKELNFLDIEQYRKEFKATDEDIDDENDTGQYGKPIRVVRTLDNKAVFTPVPDYAYTIGYEGFKIPTLLSAYDDVPEIPEEYEFIIVEGAMMYVYDFRDNIEMAAKQQKTFKKRVARMRRILIPQTQYMRFHD